MYICMYAHMYVVYARIFICVYTYVYTHECGAKRVCVPSDCVGVNVSLAHVVIRMLVYRYDVWTHVCGAKRGRECVCVCVFSRTMSAHR